jgi:hypothetical protein
MGEGQAKCEEALLLTDGEREWEKNNVPTLELY